MILIIPFLMVTSWCVTVTNPGDPTEYNSCQRQWGTSKCPEQIDALRVTLDFVYNRWNAKHPDNKYVPNLVLKNISHFSLDVSKCKWGWKD